MEEKDLEALIARANKAKTKRDAFNPVMRDAYQYAMPERDGYNAYGYGQDREVVIWDSTAVMATTRFANRVQQALFPPGQHWARLALPAGMAEGEAEKQAAAALELMTKTVFRHIQASSFDAQINSAMHDLAAGNAVLLVQPGRAPGQRKRGPLLRFTAVSPSALGWDEGPFDNIEGVFHWPSIPARLIERTYPGIEMSRELMQLATEAPEDPVELLQATVYDAEAHRWKFRVIHERSNNPLLLEREYRTSPWVVIRWAKAPGEVHGRGPLLQALADIRTLNKLAELDLMAASIDVVGVMTGVDDGVLNPDTVVIRPGVVIPVASNGGTRGPSLMRLPQSTSYRLSDILREKLQGNIRAMLFDNPLPPEVISGVTATEIQERIRRFQTDTGAFGRLHTDGVAPLMRRVVDILEDAGEFASQNFAGLMDALDDDLVQIEATSPLARAQDQAELQSIMMVLQLAASGGELGQRIAQKALDMNKAPRRISELAGVPPSLIPSEQDNQAADEAAGQNAETAALLSSPVVAQGVGALAKGAMTPPKEQAA